MLKVGLTGGIACGKTSVLAMFAELGAHTLRADTVAHHMMVPGQPMYERILAAFGEQILAPDGTIARPHLAAAAFPHRIAELNAIVHPAVLAYEDDWMRQRAEADPHGVAICEAALLIEAGGLARYDKLIVVTCTLDQKISRFAQRSGIPPEQAGADVTQRMAAQLPEDEKVKLADFVIDNRRALDDARLQVAQIWPRLIAAAQTP